MQAKAMRAYHLHHPFDDSPLALPWPTDPRTPYGSSPTSRATAQRRPCKRPQSPRYGTPASRLHTPSSNPRPHRSHGLKSRLSEREKEEAHPPLAPKRQE